MIYPFRCPSCQTYTEIRRPVTACALPQKCPQCNHIMSRVWTPFHFNVDHAAYNPGLGGAYNRSQVSDKIKQLNEEHDADYVPAEDVKVKPRTSNYDLTPNELHEVDQILEAAENR